MNKPDALTVPAVVVHVTAVFGLLLTVAVNCRVLPETMIAFDVDAETLTRLPVEDVLLPPPPQDAKRIRHENITHVSSEPKNSFRRELEPFPGNRKVTGTGRPLICAIPMQSSKTQAQVRKNASDDMTEAQQLRISARSFSPTPPSIGCVPSLKKQA